ncbi:unnamed protein product [Phytomonas sp. Hart1]|nr:unnamed protein product [Phytomonas sp. Hart1]|eukprot:CCW69124.1 unnamed protein product [Phytomonas sp. isolate Hart1]
MSLPTAVRILDACIWRTLDSKQSLSGDEERCIQTMLTTATVVEGRGRCLPIKDTLELQEICQKCWNLTALRRWPIERLKLKALYRNLITHLYLIGNNFFAPPTVRMSYLSNHRREAEQCILMCLKTAKNLSSQNMSEVAKELLEHATATSNCCTRRSESRLDYLALEILFSRMYVLKDLKEYTASAEVAVQLCNETQHHYHTYRESLLQFIFSVGEGPAADENPKSNEESSSNKMVNPKDKGHEEYIRQLLQLSINIQEMEGLTLRRQQALYGATLLQIAASFMRSGLYVEGLHYSEKAYEALQSLEPVLLQLKAHALLHHHEDAMGLFRQILLNPEGDFTLEEIFSLASLVLQSNPELAEPMSDFLTHQTGEGPGAPLSLSLSTPTPWDLTTMGEFNLRYVCLILPLRTAWGLRAVCARLEHVRAAQPDALGQGARLYFCALWSTREWEEVGEELRRRALQLALGFDMVASEEELEGVLLDLAILTFDNFLKTEEKEGVRECYQLFLAHRPVLRSVHSLTYLAQLALVSGSDEEAAQRHLRELLTYKRQTNIEADEEGENIVAAACGTLVNFFHSLDDLTTASKIAEMVIAEGGEHTDEDRIDFLKVCALRFLSNAEESPDSSLAVATLLTQHILPTLKKRPALSSSEYFWWCRFLFYISDVISKVEVNVGIEIDCVAVELFQSNCDCSLEENKNMLRNQTIFILDREFDLFVYGMPTLSVESIASFISLVQKSDNSEDNSTDRVTAFLSRVEVNLRTLPSGVSMEEVKRMVNLEKLIAAGASHYDLEALANAITFIGNQLDNDAALQYSLTVQLASAALYGESLKKSSSDSPRKSYEVPHTPDALASLVIMYYKAYQMATNTAQREEVLKAVKEKVLCNLSPSQTIQEYLEEWAKDEEEDLGNAIGEKMEIILEYFAVEAWNRAVRFNTVRNNEQMCSWRDLAEIFAHVLSTGNPSKIAIIDFLPEMPEI